MEAFVRWVQPWLPDCLLRWLLRRLLGTIVRRLRALDYPQKELRIVNKMKAARLSQGSQDQDGCSAVHDEKGRVKVAVDADKANEQHYEMPTAFFQLHLGCKLKYSSCEFGMKPFTLLTDIDLMESQTIHKYQRKLRLDELEPGDKILEIGCGWGSLLLTNAHDYPHLKFHAFSNSATQITHICAQAAERQLKNVTVWKQDVHDFVFSNGAEEGKTMYRRIVSIECIEHCRSYPALFRKLASVLTEDGQCFLQILGHREYTYFMNSKDWMGRNFFTGGTIPSMNLFLHFNEDLVVEDVEVVNGSQYANTLNVWLERMYAKREEILTCFREHSLGKAGDDVKYTFEKWRMFYLMSSECFGYHHGKEWVVGYFLLRKRSNFCKEIS
jgi:cyclopropane-fatty-acyl-phospholipid synthase